MNSFPIPPHTHAIDTEFIEESMVAEILSEIKSKGNHMEDPERLERTAGSPNG